MPDVAAIRTYVEQQIVRLEVDEERVRDELDRWREAGDSPNFVWRRHEVEGSLSHLKGKVVTLEDLLYFLDNGGQG